VLVFFVLSGFLVGGQIISRLQSGNFDLNSYVIDRATRIFVPLIPAVILTVFIGVFWLGIPFAFMQSLGNAFGLNGVLTPTLSANTPLWSLAYEIWFYIFGGALGLVLMRKPDFLVLMVLGLCVVVFAVLSPRYLLYWMLGAATCLFRQSRWQTQFLAIGAAVSVFSVVAHQLAVPSRSFSNIILVPPDVSEAMLAMGLCLCLPYLTNMQSDGTPGIVSTIAGLLAGMSYTLYLFHYPILLALDVVLPKADSISISSVSLFSLRIAICFGCAVVFYLCFEHQTVKLRRYLNLRLRGPA
jgi:peptidoglycan/LPS O-acetylase OafA/YrhL